MSGEISRFDKVLDKEQSLAICGPIQRSSPALHVDSYMRLVKSSVSRGVLLKQSRLLADGHRPASLINPAG